MKAQYILRLDDACSTMDIHKWMYLETMLDSLGIKPLVAVVPDNKDLVLRVDEADPNFWDKIRRWQLKGWTIAMHGYQHVFHHIDRKKLLLPFYDQSEFAGLSYSEQAIKIHKSWRLFKEQGIEPTVWIAPGHCFDRVTLLALRNETSIKIVSDGLACDQFFDDDFYWLPQQLWSLVEKRSGLWTVCLHPNNMSIAQIDELKLLLTSNTFMSQIVSVSDVSLRNRKKSLKDMVYSFYFWQSDRFLKVLIAFRARIKNVLS